MPASYQPLQEASVQSQKLIRLQILTPLSVLISLGANLVGSLAIKPGAGQINDDYLTVLTPRKSLIGLWWIVLYVLQICYCMLVVMAKKVETQETLIKDVGIRFCIANFLMAAWVIFWDLRIFLASEIILLLITITMATIGGTLLRHPPTTARPLDFAFVHIPMRLFLLVLFNVDIWQNGLLAFSWYKYVGEDPNQGSGKWEPDHHNHAWIVFAIVMVVGIIDATIVFLTRDAVWAIGTVYLFLAVILKGGKPAQVFIPLILLSVLQLVALLASYLWQKYGQNEGQIALPVDQDEGLAVGPNRNGFLAQGVGQDTNTEA